jgi:hypothetical protein
MEGRVKTLHPKIHGGLLCRRDKAEHLEQPRRNGIELIDLVVVNLYPVRADRRQAARRVRGGDREHRHRRSVHAAQRGEEPRQRDRRLRSGRLPGVLERSVTSPASRRSVASSR